MDQDQDPDPHEMDADPKPCSSDKEIFSKSIVRGKIDGKVGHIYRPSEKQDFGFNQII